MVGIVLVDDLDDGGFGGAVRVTDEIVMPLLFDAQLVESIEVSQQDAAAATRGHHGHIL